VEVATLPRGAAKGAAVRAMFDRIAPRYDLVNRLMTGGLDQRWRAVAVDSLRLARGDLAVDLACGTGDLAEQVAARGARTLAVDFAREMLVRGRARGIAAHWVHGDASALPLPDAMAAGLVCGFALRNFVSLPDAFTEIARVVAPGGRIALLDVDRPDSGAVRAAHGFYFDRVVPRLGALLSDAAAYRYLPRSTAYLPAADELRALIEKAGFAEVEQRRLLLGTAQIWTGVRS
jgi:demethylmenaquinone methyltransferase/2-methoxy-6-polyprenyl-1,4-benzoquinol methylase